MDGLRLQPTIKNFISATHPLRSLLVKTFEELYCAEHRCEPERFRRRLFWHALPLPIRPIALVLGGYGSPVFSADRELIDAVGLAHTVDDVREDIRDYFMNASNRRWTRRFLHLRVSTQRVKTFAKTFLPNPARKDTSAPF